jgi:uncharacterized protein YlxW (UPF0749 family)
MNTDIKLVDLLSETLSKIKSNTNDWCDFISQREVLRKLNTSHTQLNRYITKYPNQLKKYKRDRKVYYKKSEINEFINSWVN